VGAAVLAALFTAFSAWIYIRGKNRRMQMTVAKKVKAVIQDTSPIVERTEVVEAVELDGRPLRYQPRTFLNWMRGSLKGQNC